MKKILIALGIVTILGSGAYAATNMPTENKDVESVQINRVEQKPTEQSAQEPEKAEEINEVVEHVPSQTIDKTEVVVDQKDETTQEETARIVLSVGSVEDANIPCGGARVVMVAYDENGWRDFVNNQEHHIGVMHINTLNKQYVCSYIQSL